MKINYTNLIAMLNNSVPHLLKDSITYYATHGVKYDMINQVSPEHDIPCGYVVATNNNYTFPKGEVIKATSLIEPGGSKSVGNIIDGDPDQIVYNLTH